ncbi:MAG TPA: IPT/TIG domain-containing protein [Vicinamibacterales bacterium]
MLRVTPIALLIASLAAADCGGPSGPAAPTPPPVVAQPAPEPKPTPAPTGLQPTLTSVTPNVVSTSGSWGTIRGTQFEPGATVKFGNQTFSAHVVNTTEIQFPTTGTHPVGTVDVTVTNPGGFSATLPGAYTYTLPDAFDFNGEWIAHAGPEFETDMRFTIQNDVLVSIACGTDASQTTAVPLGIRNGGFGPVGDDGFTLSGSIVSAQTSFGQVNAPGCANARWWADKAGIDR